MLRERSPVVTIIMDKGSACLDMAPALLIIQVFFSERQLCFQKQDCKLSDTVYIFFHPEGQGEEIFEQNKAKSCENLSFC